MIDAITILNQLDLAPFQPFIIHLSDGKLYTITHPELVAVFINRLEIHVPTISNPRIMANVEYCALAHITRIEVLEQPTKPH